MRNWLLQTAIEEFSFWRLVSWRGYQYGCNNRKDGFRNSVRSACIALQESIKFLKPFKYSQISPFHEGDIFLVFHHVCTELIIADYEWRFPKCGAGFVKRIWINCGCNNQIVPEFSQKCLQESKKILKPLKYPRIPSFHPLLAINAPESNNGFKILFDSCKHFWENFDNDSFDNCNHIHILFTNPTSRIKHPHS